jgi:hypothetical protein
LEVSFVRPELAEAARRWREPLLWAALLATGVFLLWRGMAREAFLPLLIGALFAATGGLLIRGSIARTRLATLPPGEGLVLLDEGRIAFFGPVHGGFLNLDDLVRVEVIPGAAPKWDLSGRDGTRLRIPFAARGADILPDALSILPGFSIPARLDLIDGSAARSRVVWHRDAHRKGQASVIPD